MSVVVAAVAAAQFISGFLFLLLLFFSVLTLQRNERKIYLYVQVQY